MSADSSLGPRSFGGGPLEGNRWVRVLYLDESGIGNLRKDPYLCVAGVLIDADTQWMPISNDLAEIVAQATPEGVARPPFIHAKDVYHGSGAYHRDKWPAENRIDVIAGVSGIPAKYDVPVIWCAIDRREHAEQHPDDTPQQHLIDLYCICVVTCLLQAEHYMRGLSDKSEVCSVVLEENREIQKRLPEIMDWIRNAEQHADAVEPGLLDIMPFRKIIDNPSSQPKSASSILQVADYCAFAIKRRVQQSKGGNHLIAPITSQLLLFKNPDKLNGPSMWNPKFLGWPKGAVEFDHAIGQFRVVSKMERVGRRIGGFMRRLVGKRAGEWLSRWLFRFVSR